MKVADTDGILDRCCRCGGRACFYQLPDLCMIECCECANCSDYYLSTSEAMIKWNKEQRKVGAELKQTRKQFDQRAVDLVNDMARQCHISKEQAAIRLAAKMLAPISRVESYFFKRRESE